MSDRREAGREMVYRIRVQGSFGPLDEGWSDWFGGLAVEVDRKQEPPLTTLTGPLDQAALRGVLNRVWDLGLELVSVRRVPLVTESANHGDTEDTEVC